MIESFSGAHPFRPQCLLDVIRETDPDADPDAEEDAEPVEAASFVAGLTAKVNRGQCWRCFGPLPAPPIRPAGSRITRCRCAPICGPCGEHESMSVAERNRLRIAIGLDPFDPDEGPGWLVDPAERDAEIAEQRRQHPPVHAVVGHDSAGEGVMVTDDGATPFTLPPPSSGGWAQYGYDDGPDVAERER